MKNDRTGLSIKDRLRSVGLCESNRALNFASNSGRVSFIAGQMYERLEQSSQPGNAVIDNYPNPTGCNFGVFMDREIAQPANLTPGNLLVRFLELCWVAPGRPYVQGCGA